MEKKIFLFKCILDKILDIIIKQIALLLALLIWGFVMFTFIPHNLSLQYTVLYCLFTKIQANLITLGQLCRRSNLQKKKTKEKTSPCGTLLLDRIFFFSESYLSLNFCSCICVYLRNLEKYLS